MGWGRQGCTWISYTFPHSLHLPLEGPLKSGIGIERGDGGGFSNIIISV